MTMRHVYLGWDAREVAAYDVAESSLRRHASRAQIVTPLRLEILQRSGYLWNVGGGLDDVLDDQSPSTEFSRTRFLIPFLQDRGWALFCDCDVVFLDDVEKLFQIGRLNPSYAVMVVKHPPIAAAPSKMDGRPQRAYDRKLWSSVMLLNVEHPAHKRLSGAMVNEWPRDLLHRFSWLRDDEIGSLPPEWNWLVGIQPKPEAPKIVHYTLGGKWFPNWTPHEHDDIWLAAAAHAGGAA